MGRQHWTEMGMEREARAKFVRHSRQCPDCRGAGYTEATLMASPKMIWKMAADPDMANEPVPISKQWCRACDGVGRL